MNSVIKMLRIHWGWTQQELAQKTGVQQSTICRIEAVCFFQLVEIKFYEF
ncbi:hypothetical protein P344_01900 [Spiroplasma mirum ATCC 29335]|uniref:HTH cro/C1-type domain-containing protein n=1 Tax=Spiroplasma mirum ATCC 29335 TaxID=838561 RepID=W6AKC9_9MOLU|nr:MULTISPECIES: helix-turn-helix transcriptional regulator [Spiroplasma]AHI57728.1 hypothetical protein P344_01900 [Spiroplasma mirum ATCC 29335]